MQWSDIPFSPPLRMLRQFATLWLLFFGMLGAWEAWGRGRSTLGGGLMALAILVSVPGLIRPQILRPIFVGWMILAFPIGWTISLILLALVYYGLIVPTGLALRLAGRDPLERRFEPNRPTYWTSKSHPTDVRRYFRQF